MNKQFLALLVFCGVLPVIFGQTVSGASPDAAPDEQASVASMDDTIKSLAADINRRLVAEGASTTDGAKKAVVAQFVFQDRISDLGSYLCVQLTHELAVIPNRSWILLEGPAATADFTVSGEIVEIVNTIRVYTRIIRSKDLSLIASFHSDFNRDAFIADMLASGGSSGSGSSSVPRDGWEPDSMASPVRAELAANANGPVMNRTIHNPNDEDFFLITVDRDGILTAETTGSMDTYIEFYDADSGRKLADNDDGGSGNNARIKQRVPSGSRFIAKVRGYSRETGRYGFRAYLTDEVRLVPDEFEPDNSFDNAKEIQIGTTQVHNFHTGNDVDYVWFEISRAGRYTIRARGTDSDRLVTPTDRSGAEGGSPLDTYIELFDADQDSVASDDDGGDHLDSRISRRLEPGKYYLRVECLDGEPEESTYRISITAE